jgi:hypothetical protein
MRLGLDIHGVIDTYPEKMIELAQNTIKLGGKVFIITGPPIQKAKPELFNIMDKYGVKTPFWDKIYSIVDYMKENGIRTRVDSEGQVWAINDEDWNAVKGKIAKDIQLDLHIDDTEAYGEYFPPGVFCHMKRAKK